MDLKEKQIIYMGNKPHIKCDVVMLPTKNESSLWINCENKLKIHIKDRICPGKQEFQHLYFTSNEKIKKDDWSYNDILKEIVQNNCSSNRLVSINANGHNHKIIATTDTSLTIKGEQEGENIWYNPLPQLSQQFIEKYIEEYNKGHRITEVLVEVEEIKHYSGSVDSLDVDDDYDYIEYKLKLDSQNQITIRKAKDSWSREEVIKLLNKLAYDLSGNGMLLNHNLKIKEK